MSRARQSRRIARDHARRLGALAGAEAVEDFASGGPCGDEEVTPSDLLATLAPGQESWDTGAINADAAGSDHCPGWRGRRPTASPYYEVYYAAYEASARATVRRLAQTTVDHPRRPASC